MSDNRRFNAQFSTGRVLPNQLAELPDFYKYTAQETPKQAAGARRRKPNGDTPETKTDGHSNDGPTMTGPTVAKVAGYVDAFNMAKRAP